MRKDITGKMIVGVVCTALSLPVMAFNCRVQIDSYNINKSGYFSLSMTDVVGGADSVKSICNLEATENGVKPVTCSIWMNSAQRAMDQSRILVMQYQSSAHNSCNEYFVSNDDGLSPEIVSIPKSNSGDTNTGGGNNNGGGSSGSVELTTSPSGFIQVYGDSSSNSVALNWSNTATGPYYFEIQAEGATTNIFDSSVGSVNSYTFSGLSSSTTYNVTMYLNDTQWNSVTFQFTTL